MVVKHGDPCETSAQYITVTMNRRLRRKLARLRRLGRMAAPEVALDESVEVDKLSHTQRLEKMIRTRKWCRIRIFGLGQTRRARQVHVWRFAGLQGCVVSLQQALNCHAPLCPD